MNKTQWSYFIVIEGCDGSGKSTVAKALEKKLKDDGYDVIYTREPGGIKAGEEIRNIVKNNKLTDIEYVLLFAASMSMNINQIINPALEENKIIICDRFVRSTYIYQGFASAKEYEDVNEYLNRLNTFNIIEEYACYGCSPDVEFILDIDTKTAWNRTHIRNEETDVFEEQGYEFLDKVNNFYRDTMGDELFYNGNDDCEIVHIDASRNIDSVVNECYNFIISMINEDNNNA